ncbi:UNVERIFIED_CONTAM: hypothetical protein Sradi_0402700 [Sesamum radiatum]|uniref:SWIM-type domain-containing protein n=1 Tax=Sesamum radiatum TaxID=300843 RepID=A0AAW2W5I1_SESRA
MDRAEAKWKGVLCPKIAKIVEKNIEKSADCIPIKSDSSHWQLNCFDGSQHAVDLDSRTCSCRKWDLNGIPCKHACSVILCKGDDPMNYVNECYSVDMYKRVYKTAIMPVVGRQLWAETNCIPPLPPNFGRGAGRPPKSRRREPDEVIEEIKATDSHANKKLKVVNESSDKDKKTEILEGDNSGVRTCDNHIIYEICENPASKSASKPEATKAAPFKLPRYKKAAHKQPWLPSYKASTSHQQATAPTFTAASPTNQQPPCPPTKVNIRAPPRWRGRQEVFIKQPLRPETKSLVSTCTFFEKDGKKYVTLSRLNDVLSQSKDKGGNGKKKDGRNAPFV